MHYRGEAGTGRRNRPAAARAAHARAAPAWAVPDDRTGRFRRARPPDAPGGDPSGPSRPTSAPHRPQQPRASHPGDAPGRFRNNPPDEKDPPEQTATTTLTPHAFKTTPEQPSRSRPVRGGRAARGGAPGSTADGGDGAVHRARATGVRGSPPRPSLES